MGRAAAGRSGPEAQQAMPTAVEQHGGDEEQVGQGHRTAAVKLGGVPGHGIVDVQPINEYWKENVIETLWLATRCKLGCRAAALKHTNKAAFVNL